MHPPISFHLKKKLRRNFVNNKKKKKTGSNNKKSLMNAQKKLKSFKTSSSKNLSHSCLNKRNKDKKEKRNIKMSLKSYANNFTRRENRTLQRKKSN